MTVTRDASTTMGAILINLIVLIIAIVVFFNPQLAIGAVRLYFAIFFMGKGIGAIFNFYFSRDIKQKHLLIQGIGFAIMAIILFFSRAVTTVSLEIILITVLTIDGVLKMITAYQYKIGKMKNWYYPLVMGAISLGFALYILFTSGSGALFIIKVAAIFICWEAIANSYDVLFRGQSLKQAKKRWKVNVLYIRRDLISTSALPAKWMEKIQLSVEDDPDFHRFLEEKKIMKDIPMDGYTTLKVHIHSWDGDVITMQGHSDFSVDGFSYSYGNYDRSKHRLSGSWSDGCLVMAEEQPYLQYCLEAEKKILIEYTLRISQEQRAKLAEFATTMRADSEEWFPPIVRYPDVETDDAASLIYQAIGAIFYKFNSNQFKYYFALSTNCVRFVEQALNSMGIEDPDINGIITPGDYIDFFERKLADPNDIEVIGREVLALEEIRNKVKKTKDEKVEVSV